MYSDRSKVRALRNLVILFHWWCSGTPSIYRTHSAMEYMMKYFNCLGSIPQTRTKELVYQEYCFHFIIINNVTLVCCSFYQNEWVDRETSPITHASLPSDDMNILSSYFLICCATCHSSATLLFWLFCLFTMSRLYLMLYLVWPMNQHSLSTICQPSNALYYHKRTT